MLVYVGPIPDVSTCGQVFVIFHLRGIVSISGRYFSDFNKSLELTRVTFHDFKKKRKISETAKTPIATVPQHFKIPDAADYARGLNTTGTRAE